MAFRHAWPQTRMAAHRRSDSRRVECGTSPIPPAVDEHDHDHNMDVPETRDTELDDSGATDDESDIDLTGLDDEEEVGLDTSTGFEDADDFELPDDGEDERWSNDTEEVGDLPGADADLFQGDEYGWIGDDEPSDDDEAFDSELDDGLSETTDDGGAEGLDDDSELDDLDIGELPDLDADSEEDASGAGIDAFEELAAAAIVDERTLEIVPGQPWRVLSPSATRVTVLGALSRGGLRSLEARGPRMVGCGEQLTCFDLDQAVLRALPLPAADVTRLAVTEHEGALYVALIADGQIWLSQHGGADFALLSLPAVATHAAFTRAALMEPRLWWSSAAGELYCGESVQELTGEVRALHGDGSRCLLALVKQAGKLELAVSSDAGKTFTLHPAPGELEEGSRLWVARGGWLVDGAAGVRCGALGQVFEPFAAANAVAPALSEEEGEAYAYACLRFDDDWKIVRRPARTGAGAPVVLATYSASTAGEPRQLAVGYAEGGFLTMYVATDSALLRVDVSLDGEDLA